MNLVGFRTIVASFFSLALIAAVPATQPAPQPSAAPPAVGDKARDFSLSTFLDGKTIQLSELNKTGPVIVLQLRGWVGYECPICNRQVGEFIAHATQLQAAGARVVMLYPGPADTLKSHAADFISGKTLPQGFYFVTDPDLKVVMDWGLRWDAPGETAYPATFLIDQKGIVRFVKISHTHGGRATSAEVLKMISDKP